MGPARNVTSFNTDGQSWQWSFRISVTVKKLPSGINKNMAGKDGSLQIILPSLIMLIMLMGSVTPNQFAIQSLMFKMTHCRIHVAEYQ